MQFYLTAVGCKIHLWLLHLFGSRKHLCWQWHTRERQNGESERKAGWRGETEDRKETERDVLIANADSVIILYRTVTHVPFPTRGREEICGVDEELWGVDGRGFQITMFVRTMETMLWQLLSLWQRAVNPVEETSIIIRYVLKHGCWFELVVCWSWAGASCFGPAYNVNQLMTSYHLKPAAMLQNIPNNYAGFFNRVNCTFSTKFKTTKSMFFIFLMKMSGVCLEKNAATIIDWHKVGLTLDVWSWIYR